DMGGLACSIVEIAGADAASTGLEVTCTQTDEPVMVRADAARLEQIVWNLVSNAIKFTPPGGHVEVRVSADGNFGKLSVHDDGQGIDKPFLSRIFELFGQAPSRALHGKGGLGIGLALVKQLVERQGGRIEVASQGVGQGAAFSIWLPRFEYPAIVSPRELSVANEGAWRGVRVLIADDAVEAAETFGRLLEMDGYELAQRLRALPLGREVPLVALTGFTRAEDVHRADECGFDAHVGKPLSIGRLTATMQKLLVGRGHNGNG